MFIWSKQKELPAPLLEELENLITQSHQENDNFFTTFWGPDDLMRPTVEKLVPTYEAIIGEMMGDLGLERSSRYDWTLWVQMNNSKTDSHGVHHHFRGAEIISWVHYLKVPQGSKSFYFQGDSGKLYPEEQNTGDFVAFPSWRPHGVDPLETGETNRIIVAGNIKLKQLNPLNPVHPQLSSGDRGEEEVVWTIKNLT